MFDDLDDPHDAEDKQPLEDQSDREVLRSLWEFHGQRVYDSIEGWACLVNRYPDDLRLVFMSVAAGIIDIAGDLTPEDPGLGRLEQLAAEPSLAEPFGCLLLYLRPHARRLWRGTELARWERLATRIPKRSETDALVALEKWTRALFQTLHDATLDGKPLAPPTPKPQKARGLAPETVEQARALGREPRVYSPKTAFEVGDIVAHPTFGEGVVQNKDASKMDVAFTQGTKRLVCA